MNKNRNYSLAIALIAIPVIIYLYFLNWRTNVIYGDDINIYMGYSGLHNLVDKINIDVPYGKFRPIHGLAIQFLIDFFQKHLKYYYLFNIGIQTINTFVFAALLNFFFRSPWFSLLFGLILGLSRFSFFNIAQLFNGGALEGLAMTFFLCSLFFMVRVFCTDDLTAAQKWKGVALSILFANISMYTHERYIVIFPFIILVILIFPGLRTLTSRQKTGLLLAALGSIMLNIVLKKYIFLMPFLVGTGGTDITFSFSSALSFLADGILSIFQINSGPEYLVGIPYSSLPPFGKVPAIITCCGIFSVLFLFIRNARNMFVSKDTSGYSHFFILFLLSALFILFLIPAVITIRLEQRWLQAPFSVFILMLVIMLNDLKFKTNNIRNWSFSLLAIFFLWTDYGYLHSGAPNIYMIYSEKLALSFDQAVNTGVIHTNTAKLYIWEKQRDPNFENEVNWVLGNGSFFNFYQDHAKKIIFADSIYQRSYSFPVHTFVNFNEDSDQIVYVNDKISDITREYERDSLKSLTNERINGLGTDKMQYDQRHLLITNDDFDKFSTTGFHENENGIRWTNGNASIGFVGDFTVKDSLRMVLTCYLPPICKAIQPKISVTDDNKQAYRPVSSEKEGDKFSYTFYFQKLTTIQKINILSDTINAYPDRRTLSFPFVSLEIKDPPEAK